MMPTLKKTAIAHSTELQDTDAGLFIKN
jgi:hypothetical protein